MKIYWIMCKRETEPIHRCFFRESESESEHEVTFRIKNQHNTKSITYDPEDDAAWWYEEEDVPESEFGYCLNSKEPYRRMLSHNVDCSVGMVRKMRNGIDDDDGTCRTCPNYVDTYPKE